MADQYLSPYKQLAIYQIHKERCFFCLIPLDYNSMHIDHLIPESIGQRDLFELKRKYRLSPNFDVLGFENLVPSCLSHNLRKGRRVFEESFALIMYFSEVSGKAPLVDALQRKLLEKHKKAKAAAALEPVCRVDAVWQNATAVEISIRRHKLIRGNWVIDDATKQIHVFSSN